VQSNKRRPNSLPVGTEIRVGSAQADRGWYKQIVGKDANIAPYNSEETLQGFDYTIIMKNGSKWFIYEVDAIPFYNSSLISMLPDYE
jgi:hypothetical protein